MTTDVSIHAPAWGATRARERGTNGAWCFNPRTRVGCDKAELSGLPLRIVFQSTHPRGVRRACLASAACRGQCFNPRTRVGCDGHHRHRGWLFSGFNPRTRVGCDAPRTATPQWNSRFQSTHPRGVRRGAGGQRLPGGDVSIHAPAWGATFPFSTALRKCSSFNPRTRVGCDFTALIAPRISLAFQSTHPRGVRHCYEDDNTRTGWFQSTHPRGVRHRLLHARSTFRAFQSTHPRGVRPARERGLTWTFSRFNPRTRVGCDVLASVRNRPESLFQSTHPRGVRHVISLMTVIIALCFNPRTRVGCDQNLAGLTGRGKVSIHAPAWGATSGVAVVVVDDLAVSIHAPAWGATFALTPLPIDPAEFQSTHPRGVRPPLFAPNTVYGDVSIHAPAWGATAPSTVRR